MTSASEPKSTPAQASTGARSLVRLRQVVGAVVLVLALLYVGSFIRDQWKFIGEALLDHRISSLVLAVMLATSVMLPKTGYRILAIASTNAGVAHLPVGRIARAYALSQVISYLPGKVLGVAFEANALAGAVSLARIILANLVQYIYTNALTIAVVISVFVAIASDRPELGAGLFAIAFLLLTLSHRRLLVERLLLWISRWAPQFRELPLVSHRRAGMAWLASSLLLLEWVPYTAFWWVLLPPSESALPAAMVLGTAYAGASVLANLAVVVPAGLVVREALFLWLGTHMGIEPAALVVFGLLSRLLFTCSDLLLVSFALGLEAVRKRNP